jgi:hypothetical protein
MKERVMDAAYMKDIKDDETERKDQGVKLPYVPPRIITYTSEELLEQIGPAMACSPEP